MGLLLQNLISNALKFRHPDREPEICLDVAEEAGERVLTVRDNGIGIDPSYRRHVFQPFRRLHASSEYEGTGIGLSVVRKLVESQGGRAWVESEVGSGTTFHFTWPAQPRNRPVRSSKDLSGWGLLPMKR